MSLENIICIGFDVSLNSPGYVAIRCNDGKVLGCGFCTTVKKYLVCTGGCNATYFFSRRGKTKKRDEESVELYEARRLFILFDYMVCFVRRHYHPKDLYLGIEGYAYGVTATRSIFQLAEISGSFKRWCYSENIPLRIHDPKTIKLWATGDAYAKNVHMVDAARRKGFKLDDRWIAQGSKFKHPIVMNSKTLTHDLKGPGVDLSDAFHIADMVRHELLVRGGYLSLTQLEPEYKVKIFTRTSKHYPTNLLDRPFINKSNAITEKI
jgi:hypothetical protein